MYLIYADEADQDGQRELLVYASVFFPANNLLSISNKVSQLREKHGFRNGDSLKFSTGTKPSDVSREQHTAIKAEILRLAVKNDCKACCYVIPHAIAKGKPHEDRLKFALNTLLIKFDQFLKESGSIPGSAHFDHTEDYNQNKFLREISELGVQNEAGTRKKLDRVISVGTTQNGMSHLNSVTDIVVGSFRWVINEPEKNKVGAKLLAQLSGLLWGKMNDKGVLNVRERGLVVRPKTIKSQKYKADINAFLASLNEYQRA